jgi:hypothetical protein
MQGLCVLCKAKHKTPNPFSPPTTAVKVEGINYFADTLLFAGAILALASAVPRREAAHQTRVVMRTLIRRETDLLRISGTR